MDVSYYKEKYEPIDGKWFIKELLGEGSYGKVFRIEREDMGGKYDAALKVITIPQSEKEIESIRESLQDDNSVNQYFTNMAAKIVEEFKLMAQLKGNTNIVSYEDHEIVPHENGIGYDILIRMELLKPLNKFTDNISEQEVIKIGIDICKALEVCQKYNIVHRDIKPENIFVSSLGDYKLGDFGVAKTMKHEMTVMTTTGTYVYMAPELKKGEECGTNVDIYSLGMVMYKLLNFNREPFLPLPPEMFTFEQREQALINRMKGVPLPKPANANDRLAEIILKACEYNPKARYESPMQMRMELENLLVKAPVGIKEDILTASNDVATALDGTVGMFSENRPINTSLETEYGIDNNETSGVFSEFEQTEEVISNIDMTVSIFNKEEKREAFVEDASKSKDMRAEAKPYTIRLNKVMPSNMFRGIDVYVDGELVLNNIISNIYELTISEGQHTIEIVMTQLNGDTLLLGDIMYSKVAKAIDKGNKLLGGANQSVEVVVNSETDIYYRLNNATGGIDKVDPNKKSSKKKGVALALAIFPYTGIFGVHDFYLGKKGSGLLKMFTFNFCTIGWLIDIITILIGRYMTNDGDYLK
ncbi:MAG: protein kinase [Clostridia bacterium]|nr:protein kinase [Clostridia bacterium]